MTLYIKKEDDPCIDCPTSEQGHCPLSYGKSCDELSRYNREKVAAETSRSKTGSPDRASAPPPTLGFSDSKGQEVIRNWKKGWEKSREDRAGS